MFFVLINQIVALLARMIERIDHVFIFVLRDQCVVLIGGIPSKVEKIL